MKHTFRLPVAHNGRGKLVLGCALALLLAGGLLLFEGRAAAAVPGLVRVSESTAYDTSDHKSVLVDCPAGKRVVSPGADIVGGAGQILLDDMVIYSPTQVAVTALRHSGGSAAWELTGYAICADPLPGQTIVSGLSVTTTSGTYAHAQCPTGKRVVGAGGDLWYSNGQAFIRAIIPGPTGVAVWGSNRATALPPLKSWRVRAQAVCANPLSGLVVEPANGGQHFLLTCASGRRLLGSGAEVVNGEGVAVIDNILPLPTLNGAEITGRSISSIPPPFSMRGYRICASA